MELLKNGRKKDEKGKGTAKYAEYAKIEQMITVGNTVFLKDCFSL
jgi:hypothetical protein